jgi:HAMP domain-containing protein
MGITTKFNIALLLVSALGLGAAGWLSQRLLHDNARDEVLLQAGIMMETAKAIRDYTVDEIRPLLTMQMKRQFLPQTVPAYAATTNIRGMRESYAEYSYKEAALNPTNPADRATDWEADIIAWFRNHPDETELIGQRLAAHGEALYMARPIHITDQASKGDEQAPAFEPKGRDQIASLGRSFNRMRLSLGSAMEMLEQTMNDEGGHV